MNTARIALYDPGQMDALREARISMPDAQVVALTREVEYALEQKGVPYVSARGLKSRGAVERIVYGQKLGESILGHASMGFFAHRGISIGALYTPVLQEYIAALVYWVDIFSSLAEQGKGEIIVLPTRTVVSDTSGVLALFEVHVVEDAAKRVCEERGIPCRTSSAPAEPAAAKVRRYMRTVLRAAARILGALFNLVHTLRSKPVRILASEYWRNIAPIMKELPEAELFLLDRSEALHAGIGALWRHHVHLVSIEGYAPWGTAAAAKRRGDEYCTAWESSRSGNTPLVEARWGTVPLEPLLAAAVRRIVLRGGVRAVHTIESACAMMKRVRPHAVVVRASASQQIHFSVLCLVAKDLGIPSVEIQHGVQYVGPGSFTTRHTAEYMALYGKAAREQLLTLAYDNAKLLEAGSPRFDIYRRHTRISPQEPFTIVCVAPPLATGFYDDTYEVADYFTHLAAALARVKGQVVIKLRPGAPYKEFFMQAIVSAFGRRPVEVTDSVPLAVLFARAGMVVSPFSTALLESLLMGCPTVFAAHPEPHAVFGEEFVRHAEAGALALARTPAELVAQTERIANDPAYRESLCRRAHEVTAEYYIFDGRSAARTADMLRTLARKS